MFGDFAILYPHSVQRFEVDFLACWRHTKKATVMGAVVSLKGYRANARPGSSIWPTDEEAALIPSADAGFSMSAPAAVNQLLIEFLKGCNYLY